MSTLAGKLTESLPPKARIGVPRKLDGLDEDDQAAIIALHVDAGYKAGQIAAIVTDGGFPVNEYTVRSWLRERGVYSS